MKDLLKISLLFLTILITSFNSQGQDLVTEACYEGLKVRQIPGSNDRLRKYSDGLVNNDTIFAIIFPPENCPRCEALINPIVSTLKTIKPHIPLILISAYPDSIAAKKYIDRHDFKADHFIFDTDHKYESIFSFDAGYLHIPYLLKINPASGDLILGIRAEDNNSDLMSEFCLFDKPIEKKMFAMSKEYEGLFKPSDDRLNIKHRYTLSFPDSVTLSEIIYRPEFYNGKLFFNDKLKESIVYFRTSEQDSSIIKYQGEFKTNSRQNRQFVQIPDSIYNSLERTNDVRFIPLSPKMIDDTTLAISYSLPKLWYTGPNSIGYMNQASILMVDTETPEHSELIPLIKENDQEFFYPHFNLYKYGKDFAIGCERMTWPMEFEKEEYCDIPRLNPFTDDFYDFPQPIIASFDKKSGMLKDRIGNLPNLCKHTKTGYYFVAPVIETWEQEIVISDGFTGELTIINSSNPSICHNFKAFDIPLEFIPAPDDSTFYSYDCVAPYVNVFNRNIVDIKLTKDKIYCLIRYGSHGKENAKTDEFSVIEIDRECGCKKEKRFYNDNDRIKYCGLRRSPTGIEPYAIFKDDNNWEILIYRF